MFDWDAGSLHRLLLCIGFLALASLVFVFAFSHSISAELTCKLEEFDANSNASLQPVCDVYASRMGTAPSPLQCHYHEYYGRAFCDLT